ncbi:Core-2/I-Branching enzyme [Ancylostoma ceylanicum]|uniref:Core-2/I-Branching enzyme n=1 Tax=Ancylostoma ceylanicum TaxID=53326 RepID=A0A0D6LLW2_9BILA|nr:Core-2/I-Branching enzyme [Ancylostoma ceylanicum]
MKCRLKSTSALPAENVQATRFRTPAKPATEGEQLFYPKAPETVHIDCGRILRGDKRYAGQIARNRSKLMSNREGYSCDAIRKRVLPALKMKKMESGVAHARDYVFIEEELRSSYHPQNYFCYTIDSKASSDFRRKMRQLPACFPNVYVVSEEFNIDSWGRSMNKAHFECLKLLMEQPGWSYAILLQNHDLILKSVYEMVEIYRLLGGANDVEIVRAPPDMYDNHKKWDARSLNLFGKGSHASNSQMNATLRFAKGVVQASISRAAVDWMVNTVNLTTLIEQINQEPFSDELLLQSLQVSDDLDMPGRFTLTYWATRPPRSCLSGNVRHDICIVGVEHLPGLSGAPQIMVNKALPDFDYGAIECVHELLFNRTFLGQVDKPLNASHYLSLGHVIYHKNRNDHAWLASMNCSDLIPLERKVLRAARCDNDVDALLADSVHWKQFK